MLQFFQYITSLFFKNNELPFLILAILINKILTAINCALLMNFVNSFNTFSRKTVKLIGILFLFNPSAIFYHSLYSEPIFMFLSLIGLTYAF